ncbi:Flp pilus assembly complex ATPase component TadA [bacterium]|nr:Flp pilus assembly complex ATPase component TadA [bacterium]
MNTAPSNLKPKPSSLDNKEGKKDLLDILAKKGLLTPQQVEQVRLLRVSTGKKEEDILLEKKMVKEEDLLKAKAELWGVPYVNLETVGFSPQSLTLIPQNLAEYYHLVPFEVDQKKKTLSVAMVNPLDLETIEFLEKKTGYRIIAYLASRRQIEEAINQSYAHQLTEEVTQALEETKRGKLKTAPDLDHLEEVIKEAPIARVVSTILEYAVKSRASDIHIEPEENETRVRYRIDGILQEKLRLPRRIHDAVVSRIKILSHLKIDEKRVPQDGRFTFIADGEEIDLRVSTAPTVYGEKVVMRLLKKSQKIPTLPELGLRGKALRDFQEAITRPHGMIIVCGPTGSGKTTTLYSALSQISTTKVNVMTIEDPVEYQIEGVNQVQVNPRAGLTFSSALRSFLRQDPDIIMVGEIRDEETAALAVHAALTGHLVFSTLHTNDAAGAAPRLIDMKVEPFLLVSSLTAVVGQRIVRRICPHCKEEYTPPPEVKENVAQVLGNLLDDEKKKNLKLYRGRGCTECNNTGYYGRIGIFEVLTVDEAISQLILKRATASEIQKAAVKKGMITMMQDGYLKAVEGITSVEEVLRVAKY